MGGAPALPTLSKSCCPRWAACMLYPQEAFDRLGQLYGQLVQVRDVQKGIPVNTLDVFLVVADGGGQKEDSLAPVLLLDAPQVLLGGGAVIARGGRLAVGDQHQEPQ